MSQETGLKVTTCRSSSVPEEQPVRPMTHPLRQCISVGEGLWSCLEPLILAHGVNGCCPSRGAASELSPARERWDWCSSMSQPRRGGRFAASAAASRLLLALKANPGLAPWARFFCRFAALGRSRLGQLALAILVLLGVNLSLHAQVAWNFVGPPGAPARVVGLASDPRSDFILYFAAPGAGVWKSTDGGSSWVPIADLLSSLQVCSIAIDSRSPDVLYVGTGYDQNPRPSQTVARSEDGGRTWTTGPRFTNQPVCALAVDPANSSPVLAGSAEGLFLSLDAGTSWNKIAASPVTSIAFDNVGSVYVGMPGDNSGGTFTNILIRSSDGGSTWSNISLPASPYASDAQTTWVSIIADANAVSVTVSYQLSGQGNRANPSLIDFYRSTDGGNTWSDPIRVGAGHPPNQLFLDSASGTLYLAGDLLMASANQGISWVNL